jgi:predicted secreted protein
MAPFSQLTAQLRQALFSQSLPKAWKTVPELFVWTLVVGGIASSKTESVTWFAAMLSQVAVATNLSTWADVKKILKSVLWLSPICDEKGEDLWKKADNLRAQVQRHQEQQQHQRHEVPMRLRAEPAS